MNSAQALELIEAIGAASSRTDKQAILTGLLQTDLGKFICKWSYDPFITYGIKVKKMPAQVPQDYINITDGVVLRVLKGLSTRELTGNKAADEINTLFKVLNEPSRQIFFKILARDWKVGISNSTIAAVLPNFLPSFGVMRAHPYEEKRVQEFPMVGEPKLDGWRSSFIAFAGQGAFFTRSGSAMDGLAHMAPALMKALEYVRDMPIDQTAATELGTTVEYLNLLRQVASFDENGHANVMIDSESVTGLFATTNVVRSKTEDAEAEMHAFDIVPYAEFVDPKPFKMPYIKRRKVVELFVKIAQRFANFIYWTPRKALHSHEEVYAYYDECQNMTLARYLARGDAEREAELLKVLVDKQTGLPKGLEGAMVKDPRGFYEKKKSYSWMKLKAEETIDLFITGFFNGEEGTKYENMMGGAIVDHDGVEVRVGGGWSDEEREQLWKDWCHDADIVGVDPLVGFKKGWSTSFESIQRHAHRFKFLGRMLEIKFNEVTPDGSLRHPRKIRFRDDKAGEAMREWKAAA
jgi:ATP-dependent DNA ligase